MYLCYRVCMVISLSQVQQGGCVCGGGGGRVHVSVLQSLRGDFFVSGATGASQQVPGPTLTETAW